MGQYWQIVALDSKRFLPKYASKLGEFLLWSAVPRDLEALLRVPVEPNYDDFRGKDSQSNIKVEDSNERPAGLLRLPTELHHHIFEHCGEARILCLGLTSRYFWSLASQYVIKSYMSCLGSWAGQRLINVGDYMRVGDDPPCLSETELKVQESAEDAQVVSCEPHITPLEKILRSVQPERSGLKNSVMKRIFQELLGSHDASLRRASDVVEKTLYLSEKDFFPENEIWILRNLTTREYARPEYFEEVRKLCDFVDVGQGFGVAVLCRISWSSDTSISMEDPTRGITRGIWAGHCFDIITMARHEELTAGEPWHDISKKLSEEIIAICKANV